MVYTDALRSNAPFCNDRNIYIYIYICHNFYYALDNYKIIVMFHLCAFCWFYYYNFVLLFLFLVTTLVWTLEPTQRFRQSVKEVLVRC
jgi:hypothetical protein